MGTTTVTVTTSDKAECQRCNSGSTCFVTSSQCFMDAALQVPSPWPCIRICGRYPSTFSPPLSVSNCASSVIGVPTAPVFSDACTAGVTGQPANVTFMPASCATNSSFSSLSACTGASTAGMGTNPFAAASPSDATSTATWARGCLQFKPQGPSALADAGVKQMLGYRMNRCLIRAADGVPVLTFDHSETGAPSLLLRLSVDEIAFTTVIRSGKASASELFGRFGGAVSLLMSVLAVAKGVGMGFFDSCTARRAQRQAATKQALHATSGRNGATGESPLGDGRALISNPMLGRTSHEAVSVHGKGSLEGGTSSML
jgi:hypothetical protein